MVILPQDFGYEIMYLKIERCRLVKLLVIMLKFILLIAGSYCENNNRKRVDDSDYE